ncbi:MAG: hypothetical protein II916_00250 [Oscillospiraceae bacterium]|nr:hypothetical protein [Oscillospiraceae bacterium]
MKNPKMIAGLLALGVLLCGCSRHPKADFSVPTESTEPTTTVAETQAFTVPTEAPEPGFSDADTAYQAYLDAYEARDVDAFCALFSEAEIEASGKVPSKFLKNNFGLKQDTDYQNYLSRTDFEVFRNIVAANFNTCQSQQSAFGAAGEVWKIEPGKRRTMQDTVVNSFANSLHLDITRGVIREMFYFVGQESGEQVEGQIVYLLCIDGRWYPCYTKECVPTIITLSDIDPEFSTERSESED